MSTEQICNVLVKEDEPDLTILFRYGQQQSDSRLFTMRRKRKESLSDLSKRMKLNIEKVFRKGSKKHAKPETSPEFDVVFYRNEVKVEDLDNFTNQTFWLDGSKVVINEQVFNVHVNLPSIGDLRLSPVILSGYRIFPQIKLDHGNVVDSTFRWYKRLASSKEEWIHVGDEFTYAVTDEDIGYIIRVVCIPSDGKTVGVELEAISPKPVIKGPSECPFRKRDIGQLEADCFRVISYNLLADIYAGTSYSAANLFAYCKPQFLAFDYRKLIIVEELLHYKADIFFLQEVDKSFYENALRLILLSQGYESRFCCKKEMVEGLSIVFRDDGYVCLREELHNIGELLLNSDQFSELRDQISINEKLFKKMTTLKNSCQILLLQCKTTKRLLLVANVHLYSQGVADLIRLLQAYVCFHYLETSRESIQQEYPSEKVAILISGDFNSTPEFAVVRLATKQKVDSTLEDFRTSKCKQSHVDYSNSFF